MTKHHKWKATNMLVRDKQDVGMILQIAQGNRKTASTSKNDTSSRSHCIYQLRIQGESEEFQLESVMSLIDLAGSERADDKQFDQDRIREAKAINKSLSTLKDCIAPIVKNQSLEENDPKIHVPYRNSPLTFMLQDCLSSESSKTLMIWTSWMSIYKVCRIGLSFCNLLFFQSRFYYLNLFKTII